MLKGSPILLGVFAKCPTSSIRLVVISYFCPGQPSFFFPGMIIHGHRDVKYAHYGLDFYPSDANHRVGLFAKLLRNLEKPPVHSSYAFFDGCGTTPFMRQCFRGRRFVYRHCWNPPTLLSELTP